MEVSILLKAYTCRLLVLIVRKEGKLTTFNVLADAYFESFQTVCKNRFVPERHWKRTTTHGMHY